MTLVYLKNILQLILAPSRGWEDMAYSSFEPQDLMRRMMYPYMGLASLSIFMKMIYDPEARFTVLLIKSVVIFVSFFLTFYFAQMMFRSLFHKMCTKVPSERHITIVLTYCISLLSVATVVCNLLPVNLGLKYLLPLGVALIMWKSDEYLSVKPEFDFIFVFFCLITTIIPPTLIQQLFDVILV